MLVRKGWKFRALLLVLLAFVLSQCGHLQTHEGKCDEALKKYNNLMATYRTYYPVQGTEIQAKWKAEIAPKLKTMSQAVDLCTTDVSGFNTAMLVYDEVNKIFLAYSIKVQEVK